MINESDLYQFVVMLCSVIAIIIDVTNKKK